MKFLLAQINPVVGDLEGNAKKILFTASKASSNFADLVLTKSAEVELAFEAVQSIFFALPSKSPTTGLI